MVNVKVFAHGIQLRLDRFNDLVFFSIVKIKKIFKKSLFFGKKNTIFLLIVSVKTNLVKYF